MTVDPSGCAQNTVDIHGARGAAWLESLPALLAGYAERRSLTLQPPFADLSYNYVCPATLRDGTPVVVKAGVPHLGFAQEVAALRVFDGRGMARLLDADVDEGIMLLERLLPGAPLSSLGDDEAETRIAAQLMRALWRPATLGPPFATVAGWAAGLSKLRDAFGGGTGPFPPRLVDRAEGLFADLLSSPAEPMLIHGDAHGGNMLSAQREPWLAMDPKGVTGDPLFDVGYYLNSLPKGMGALQARQTLERRADQLAGELGYGRECIVAWAVALAVLSGWWSYEDHGAGWEGAFARAALLAEL